jgi:hypothetical protein
MISGEQGTMGNDSIKRAAEEYLAERLTEEGLNSEQKLNREVANAQGPAVWKHLVETVTAMCDEWNFVTKDPTLTCKETMLGDLRIRCAGRATHQIIVHYEPKRRLVRVENTARLDHEPKVVLSIEGYATGSGRSARLMRNNEPVNVEMLMLGQIRVLAGLSRRGNY